MIAHWDGKNITSWKGECHGCGRIEELVHPDLERQTEYYCVSCHKSGLAVDDFYSPLKFPGLLGTLVGALIISVLVLGCMTVASTFLNLYLEIKVRK